MNLTPVPAGENIFSNHLVEIPSSLLQVGKNFLTMDFLNKYRKDGVGLHSFVDSVDKEQYTYSQFEADFCHYVFPNFDQPDLKARWTFMAQVDHDWTVISNEYVQSDTP